MFQAVDLQQRNILMNQICGVTRLHLFRVLVVKISHAAGQHKVPGVDLQRPADTFADTVVQLAAAHDFAKLPVRQAIGRIVMGAVILGVAGRKVLNQTVSHIMDDTGIENGIDQQVFQPRGLDIKAQVAQGPGEQLEGFGGAEGLDDQGRAELPEHGVGVVGGGADVMESGKDKLEVIAGSPGQVREGDDGPVSGGKGAEVI